MSFPKYRILSYGVVILAFAGWCTNAARADEIRLKDGKKLHGVIVGYEDNMFKVKTDFGYVLVEKNKIASIVPDTPAEPAPAKTEPEAKPSGATETKAAPGKKRKSAPQREWQCPAGDSRARQGDIGRERPSPEDNRGCAKNDTDDRRVSPSTPKRRITGKARGDSG